MIVKLYKWSETKWCHLVVYNLLPQCSNECENWKRDAYLACKLCLLGSYSLTMRWAISLRTRETIWYVFMSDMYSTNSYCFTVTVLVFAILMTSITKSHHKDWHKKGNPKLEPKPSATNILHSHFSLLLHLYLKIKCGEKKTIYFVTTLLTIKSQWCVQHANSPVVGITVMESSTSSEE